MLPRCLHVGTPALAPRTMASSHSLIPMHRQSQSYCTKAYDLGHPLKWPAIIPPGYQTHRPCSPHHLPHSPLILPRQRCIRSRLDLAHLRDVLLHEIRVERLVDRVDAEDVERIGFPCFCCWWTEKRRFGHPSLGWEEVGFEEVRRVVDLGGWESQYVEGLVRGLGWVLTVPARKGFGFTASETLPAHNAAGAEHAQESAMSEHPSRLLANSHPAPEAAVASFVGEVRDGPGDA